MIAARIEGKDGYELFVAFFGFMGVKTEEWYDDESGMEVFDDAARARGSKRIISTARSYFHFDAEGRFLGVEGHDRDQFDKILPDEPAEG
jgi:hypothetical protein